MIIGKVDGHIECNSGEHCSAECHSVKEKSGSKYLVFDSTDKNKEVLKKDAELWGGVKDEIKTMAVKKVNMIKILWKLNLMQMIICHYINH